MKKLTALTLGAFITVSAAQAVSVSHWLSKELAGESPTVQRCENFGGTWSGQCTIGGESTEHNTFIHQNDCDSLFQDGEHRVLGGLSTTTSSMPAGGKASSLAVMVRSDWVNDRLEIKTVFSGSYRAVGDSAQVVDFTGGVYMRKENGQLLTGGNFGDISVACVYDKK